MCKVERERERDRKICRERETERDRQTDRQRQRQTERYTERGGGGGENESIHITGQICSMLSETALKRGCLVGSVWVYFVAALVYATELLPPCPMSKWEVDWRQVFWRWQCKLWMARIACYDLVTAFV